MSKRDFISINDFSTAEFEELFAIAEKMNRLLKTSHGILAGHILGSLFLEPSTRTRLSFEAAMNRLGGRVITVSDAKTSSFAKGESLADSVRIVSSYADVIVLRHPKSGAARLAAEYATVPVINAGDGGHEHPTQTLCDLFTLRTKKGRLNGLRVVLYGDLKYGRTTHSLAVALARFGADVLCVPERGLELPDYIRVDCTANGCQVIDLELCGVEAVFGTGRRTATLICADPERWARRNGALDLARTNLDAIYVTRVQRERLATTESGSTKSLPNVDTKFLAESPFENALVLHPLPRLDEIAGSVDSDPRGVYFQQAALGVPIRMALLAVLLERETMRLAPPPERRRTEPSSTPCRMSECISSADERHVEARRTIDAAGTARCGWCDHVLSE